jgi:dephospho-CoA kinase
MKIIALTGGIASGKTTVANLFHSLFGIDIIDTDIIARDVLASNSNKSNKSDLLTKIIEKFGPDVLDSDDNLDRRKLRDLVFSNKNNKIWLEQLVHPMIDLEVKNKLKLLKANNLKKSNYYCLIVIPLLTQQYLNTHKFIDQVLVVDCPESQQITRGQLRDNQSSDQILNIINQQISRENRLLLADDIILNDQNINHLKSVVLKLHQKYSEL